MSVLRTAAFLFIVLFAQSTCVFAEEIQGKFVFNSVRTVQDALNRRSGEDSAYILREGKISFLGKALRRPKFSPDGKWIASHSGNAIIIMDEEGSIIHSIPFSNGTSGVEWAPDGKSFIFLVYEEIKTRLCKYDLVLKKSTDIMSVGYTGSITMFFYSPNGDRILFTGRKYGERSSLNICAADGSGLKTVHPTGLAAGWFPDGKHIACYTNVDEKGNRINDRFGAVFKMNLETGESVKLRDLNFLPFYSGIELSKDGKYLYTAKTVRPGGMAIVLWPLDDPTREILVTKPIKIDAKHYSEDEKPDWFQGESS